MNWVFGNCNTDGPNEIKDESAGFSAVPKSIDAIFAVPVGVLTGRSCADHVLSTRCSRLWYVAETGMKRASNILAAVLALVTLAPTAFGQSNLICVESSGRISFGCDDVLPDDMVARTAVPPHFGVSLQGCGFCHDFSLGKAVSHSFQDSAFSPPVIGLHQVMPSRVVANLRDVPRPVAFLDTSGGISQLKC